MPGATCNAERLRAQALAGEPLTSAEAVAGRVLAVQAQDAQGFRLAVRARTSGLTVADVERALTEDRSLVVNWLNRRTLHLVGSADHAWLHALTTRRHATWTLGRLAQEGVEPSEAERGAGVVEAALAADGPLTRPQLRERLDAAGVRTAGQALIHVLALACVRGAALRGPVVGTEQAYVLVRDWLGEPPVVDRDAALAELARRYLAGHGPARDRDLARWSGLGLREVRAGLQAIGGELDELGDGLVRLRSGERAGELPPPRLLGRFDPVLHGWESREWVTGEHTGLVTVGGIFKAFALVEGRAAALWTLPRGRVELAPLEPLDAGVRAALDADARDVERFLAR